MSITLRSSVWDRSPMIGKAGTVLLFDLLHRNLMSDEPGDSRCREALNEVGRVQRLEGG